METDPNQHLAMPEMAKLLEVARQRGDADRKTAEVHPHLAVCSACREQFESVAEVDSQLRSLRSGEPGAETSDCPSAETWREVAAGLTEQDRTLTYVGHASRCDHCGPLLRAAVVEVEGLNRGLTDAEREQIAGLESARPEWQNRLAQRISGHVRPGPEPRPSWWPRWLSVPRLSVPRLAAAGVTIALVAAVVWWTTDGRGTPGSANQLLARAYTDQRTLELRIPGAAYAPLRVQRGPAESFVARPAALLKAEALIASQMASHPDDPAWLQAAGRADLLEGKYDAAVESLQRALELRPDAPEILLDLGTARFQRAQSEDRQEDFGAAFEYLSKVLKQQPQNATALFNRAIVGEHQFLYHQALEDWENYLKVDPGSQWAEEARNHADAVRTKLKEHGQARPLLAPAELTPAVMETEVDSRVEEYLGEAVRKWLPSAFPEFGTREADPGAQRALFLLADLTTRNHNDRWLSDLLQGSSSKQFAPAVAALARSAAANDAGDYGVSAEQGARAEKLFQATGNQAGVLRAQFEQVFADQLTRRSDECRRDAAAALKESERYPYSWLQIQLGLEKGVCSCLMEDWGTYESASRHSADRAHASTYNGLYVRALGFMADEQIQTGGLAEGLGSVEAGLGRYWSAQVPIMWGYNLYQLLGDAREVGADRPNLQVAIWREAAALVEADGDLLLRAWAHSYAARAAAAAQEPQTAERQYEEAARLFALAPQTEARRGYVIENEIRTAQLDAHLGQYEAGIAHLTSIQDQIGFLSNMFLVQMFYSALGELQLRGRHPEQAEQAFQPALKLAEQRLTSLSSETERASWSRDAASMYLGMAEAELAEGRNQESLEWFEWYLGAAARVVTGGAGAPNAVSTAPDPTWLTSRLPLLTDRTVLAYAVLPDGFAIWAYDNRGVTAQWFPQSDQELQELAARFYDLASDPDSETIALQRDSQRLYQALIAPVEQRLEPGRTLMIEATGWFAQVPFEALLDSNGHYLIERFSVVHALGQGIDAHMHGTVQPSPNLPTLVVGSTASSQTEGLVPLPDSISEVDAIAQNFRSPTKLTGSEVTLSAIESHLPGTAIFHYTGHSLSTPRGSALLLNSGDPKNQPALLTADWLRRHDLRNLQLAVLSTCNTELGDEGARGFSSIAEALQRAGVPHVVASRWAVDSAITRVFIEDFYRGLLSGQPVSEAIHQASRRRMVDPRTSHPYYWSAFSAYGQP